MRRSPSARTVASCLGDRPMSERVSVTLSVLSANDRLLYHRAVTPPPRRVQVLQALDPAQRVDRRLEHVVRVVGAERLREDVLHARRFEDRPHRAAGDDSRARHRRLQEDPTGAEVTGDLARDRRLLQRHEDQVLLRVLHRLADRLGHLVGLAETDTHVAPTVADHHQRRERESPTTLDDLGHAVDGDNAVIQLEHARIDPRFCHSVLPWEKGAPPPSRLPCEHAGACGRPLSTPPRTRGATGRLENEPAGASRVGKRLHAPVVHIAAAIEYHALDSLRLRLLGQELSNEFGGGDVAPGGLARTEHLAPTVHGQERSPRVVVYELRVDVVQAAEHGQPRPRLGAAQESAEPPMPDVPRRAPLLRDHLAPAPAFLPTFRRITSFAYLMPLPLYGSGFRSARSLAAVWPRSALSAPRNVIDTWRSISAVMPSGSAKITGC